MWLHHWEKPSGIPQSVGPSQAVNGQGYALWGKGDCSPGEQKEAGKQKMAKFSFCFVFFWEAVQLGGKNI